MPGRANPVSLEARGTLGPEGGIIRSKGGELSVAVAAGAAPAGTTLIVRNRAHSAIARKSGAAVAPVVAFDLELSDALGRKLPGQLADDATITLDYSRMWLGDIIAPSLTFYTLDENTNRWEPVPTQNDVKNKKLVARTRHFSGWAATGDLEAPPIPSMEAVQTSTFTRSAEVNIDLKLPPGLGNIVPKLTLRHRSNGINRMDSASGSSEGFSTVQASWAGLGWSMDLGQVAVRASTTDHERFSMSFGGMSEAVLKKSPATNQWGQLYMQNESFHKIWHESNGDYWIAIAKDGTKYYFGQDKGADQNNSDPTNTGSCQDGVWMNGSDGNPHAFYYRWFLDRIEDTNGNVVTIKYEGTRPLATGRDWNSYYDRSVYPRGLEIGKLMQMSQVFMRRVLPVRPTDPSPSPVFGSGYGGWSPGMGHLASLGLVPVARLGRRFV